MKSTQRSACTVSDQLKEDNEKHFFLKKGPRSVFYQIPTENQYRPQREA